MKTSVIVTVKNEGESIHRLLDSLAAQTRAPDEVVICDGGSTDGTLDALSAEQRLPLKVIVRPGANISQGRNAAIAEARGDVIASTDAGVVLVPEWLQELAAPFERGRAAQSSGAEPCPCPPLRGGPLGAGGFGSEPAQASTPSVVAGFFLPDARTPFEVAMGATVLPQLDEIRPDQLLPSSRSVAFRKEAWQAVGGYPEWLDYCEDLIFDLALRTRFGPFAFAPKAIAHFRPRGSLRAFFRQYYLYARGDGKADLFRRRHAIRYITYLIAAPATFLAGLVLSPWWWLLFLVGVAAYTFRPYRHLARMWGRQSAANKLQAALLVPIIRVTGDIAKMAGYPVGVMWRVRRE
jgi:glycosyltransferase involved in cell wall biosynthesis